MVRGSFALGLLVVALCSGSALGERKSLSKSLGGRRRLLGNCDTLDNSFDCAVLVILSNTWGGLWGNYIGTGSMCTWPFVTCDNSNIKRVVSLSLNYERDISSPMWAEAGINVAQLDGTIPNIIGNLTALTYLDLGGNTLRGTVPPTLGFNNTILARVGTATIRGLSKLTYLNLSSNALSGTLPDSLAGLTQFATASVQIMMDNNQLTGSIPNFCNNLTLGSVKVGSVTTVTCTCMLSTLTVAQNFLSGVLPTGLLGNASGPAACYARSTATTVVNPVSYRLTTLDVANNRLRGSLPAFISKLQYLTTLSLANNTFNGTFPILTGPASLVTLNIALNRFSGNIPNAFGPGGLTFGAVSLSIGRKLEQSDYVNSVYTFNASSNNFTGALPAGLALTGLNVLDLSKNQLSGPLDPVTKMTTLNTLDLSSNRFAGQIPPTGFSSYALNVLSLANNSFSGKIPAFISNLYSLRSLDLSSNPFTGVNKKFCPYLPFLNDQAPSSPSPEPTPSPESAPTPSPADDPVPSRRRLMQSSDSFFGEALEFFSCDNTFVCTVPTSCPAIFTERVTSENFCGTACPPPPPPTPPTPPPPAPIPNQLCVLLTQPLQETTVSSSGAIITSGTGTNVPTFEVVSTNNVNINCTLKRAVSYATVVARFWSGTVPADSAILQPAPTQNCGVDITQPCNGPILYANFNSNMYATVTATQGVDGFPARNLVAFPSRANPTGSLWKHNGYSFATHDQPSDSSAVPRPEGTTYYFLSDINDPAFADAVNNVCGACGASLV